MHADPKVQRLFLVLSGVFIANAIMAEFIGVKIFALEATLGIDPFEWNLYGQSGSLNFTAGVLLWPVVFLLTDVVNEYFGRRGVRFISWLAVALIVYAFAFAYLAIGLAPAPWWVTIGVAQGVPDMQAAYAAIFGQGLWTIGGSITAFLIGQLVDVRDLPRGAPAHRRIEGVAARDRLDPGLAAGRHGRGALHRLRAGAAAVVDPAVPGRGHGQLRLQGAGRDHGHAGDLRHARRDRPLAGAGARGGAQGAGGGGVRLAATRSCGAGRAQSALLQGNARRVVLRNFG